MNILRCETFEFLSMIIIVNSGNNLEDGTQTLCEFVDFSVPQPGPSSSTGAVAGGPSTSTDDETAPQVAGDGGPSASIDNETAPQVAVDPSHSVSAESTSEVSGPLSTAPADSVGKSKFYK